MMKPETSLRVEAFCFGALAGIFAVRILDPILIAAADAIWQLLA